MYPNLSDIEEKLTIHVSRTLALSTKRSPEETASALLSWQRAKEFYDEMASFLGPLKGKKLLEIGCGYGLFLAICKKNKIKAAGIEPANQEFYKFTLKFSKEILKRCGFSKNVIKNGIGEKLPYKDNTFDVVVSLYTLEHVQDVSKVLAESTRVLKPGGYLYCVVPNYGSFWEGHYGIFWIPYIVKPLAKLYVRLWGKSPEAIDEYQFVNQISLEKQIRKLPLKVKNWGNELFIKKVQELSISGNTLGSARRILGCLRFLKLLKFSAHIASFFKAQTPIILVAQKVSSAVCYFGSYDPNYARNKIIKIGLEYHGFKVYECQAQGLFITRYFKLTKYFLKNHKNFEAIIVGFPGHLDMPLAAILGKIFRKKVFFDIFASTYETYVLDREVIKKNSPSSKIFYFIDWFGLHLADYVIVDTYTHADFYHKLYGLSAKKQIVVYVGSDNQIFKPRKIKEETDVLFYGSYQPLQGTDVIIKAASRLPNIKFKLVGQGQMRGPAEDLAKKLKLKNVEFINWLPIGKLAEEISKAKITLGIFGANQKANVVIPNKVYDSLASGKPIISSDTKAIRELLDDTNAILTAPGSDSQLVQAVESLIKNKSKRQKIAQNGYKLFTARLKPRNVVKNIISKIDEK